MAPGNLIGTTVQGGSGSGTIFRIKPRGERSTEAVLYNFCSLENCADGYQPQGAALDINGDVVGVAYYGGAYQSTGGTVFKLHKNTLTVLNSFCAKNACTDGQKSGYRHNDRRNWQHFRRDEWRRKAF